MKGKFLISSRRMVLAVGFILTVWAGSVSAAGLLTPVDSGLPELDIKEHSVSVVLEDGYALTTVEQVFYNPHSQDLEAVYSFPVPDKAAVSDFTMWIDGKPVSGEVLEKEKAREVYEDQKAQDKNAGITEKNGYKTFEIRVTPVRAGRETKIRLGYIQPAHVDTNIGRYVYPLEEGGVDEEALAFWSTQDKVTGIFRFDLVLRSGYPVASVRLPNHPQAQVVQHGEEWLVHLDNLAGSSSAENRVEPALTLNHSAEDTVGQSSAGVVDPAFRLNTDIVVYYRLEDHLPGSVDLVAYKEEGSRQGTFMLTVTPGMDLQPITEGRDWVFILDVSGSMQGKYATLAEGVSRALNTMSDRDRFRIILFNNTAREMTRGFVVATPDNVKQYTSTVAGVHPENGTNLYAGLQLGLKSLDADRTSSLILVTDGVANVGVTEQRKFIKLIKECDIRLFTFIMGNSANKPLLEVLTRVSNGFALNVSNSDDIIGKILLAQSKAVFEALHGARLKVSGIKTADISPAEIGSLYRGQQLVVLGHYFGSGDAEIVLEGKISGEQKTYRTRFDFPETAGENPEIERLWAYAMIEHLKQDMDDFGEQSDIKQSITDIGVEYGLVTDYTSMVVVEEAVFDALGIDRRNKRRLQKESLACQQRASRPVRTNRVDAHQPMFGSPRPVLDGAGALDPLSLAIISPLLWGFRPKRRMTIGKKKR